MHTKNLLRPKSTKTSLDFVICSYAFLAQSPLHKKESFCIHKHVPMLINHIHIFFLKKEQKQTKNKQPFLWFPMIQPANTLQV